jgi:toxin FitB
MSYLFDTNTISERVRPRPDPGIAAWLDEVDEDRTYLSVITVGEIRKGVPRLAGVGQHRRLIAATAKVHQLQVVTRNVHHFQPAGVEVLCPWQG